jgi:hypothetical protein
MCPPPCTCPTHRPPHPLLAIPLRQKPDPNAPSIHRPYQLPPPTYISRNTTRPPTRPRKCSPTPTHHPCRARRRSQCISRRPSAATAPAPQSPSCPPCTRTRAARRWTCPPCARRSPRNDRGACVPRTRARRRRSVANRAECSPRGQTLWRRTALLDACQRAPLRSGRVRFNPRIAAGRWMFFFVNCEYDSHMYVDLAGSSPVCFVYQYVFKGRRLRWWRVLCHPLFSCICLLCRISQVSGRGFCGGVIARG